VPRLSMEEFKAILEDSLNNPEEDESSDSPADYYAAIYDDKLISLSPVSRKKYNSIRMYLHRAHRKLREITEDRRVVVSCYLKGVAIFKLAERAPELKIKFTIIGQSGNEPVSTFTAASDSEDS
jgi:hypothetical protein